MRRRNGKKERVCNVIFFCLWGESVWECVHVDAVVKT